MQTHPVYAVDTAVSVEEYRQLLLDSGLDKYRPVDDVARLDGVLVGIARSVTDRVFCCWKHTPVRPPASPPCRGQAPCARRSRIAAPV